MLDPIRPSPIIPGFIFFSSSRRREDERVYAANPVERDGRVKVAGHHQHRLVRSIVRRLEGLADCRFARVLEFRHLAVNLHSQSVVLAAVLAIAIAPGVAVAESGNADACISFWGEARFGAVGFDHIVHIANRCAASVACAVSTDLDRAPQAVTVPGNQAVLVVTHLGSPASKFTPHVTCRMDP